jgi:hypothetical protein
MHAPGRAASRSARGVSALLAQTRARVQHRIRNNLTPMYTSLKRAVILLVLPAFVACLIRAEETASKGPPLPPPEASQFDFWIGEWKVTTPDGKFAGRNRVDSILGGRGLQENWTGAGGFTGTSLNVYDAKAKVWRQFWVDRSGGVLQLAGGMVNGSMVMEGSGSADGKVVVDRITWTPNADGSVRQLWERSDDGRGTWSTVFDGLYRKVEQ